MALKEFDLLACLLQNRSVTLSRQTLFEQVWGNNCKSNARTVDVHIRWLREKIEQDSAHPRYIHTARGRGYRFTEGTNEHQARHTAEAAR